LSSKCATVVLSGTVTVAEGLYAPGHLGELTQYIPFELVDDILEQTRARQARLRMLPSRVGVYFTLALALFPALGYARVRDKLTAGLCGLCPRSPSEKSLRDLRRRLGAAPLRLLFETVAGSAARPGTPGVCYRRWRTVAFDGCSSAKAPDRPRVCAWLGKIKHRYGQDGYPMLRIVALCETGTRALLGAVFGPVADCETVYAGRLLSLLDASMLLLDDPGLRRRRFPGQDRRYGGAAAGAAEWPPGSGQVGLPARRVVPDADQRSSPAHHRRGDHRDHQRRAAAGRPVPAGHDAGRSPALPRGRAGGSLP